jgi:AhpD family alkylhydroperoxidase
MTEIELISASDLQKGPPVAQFHRKTYSGAQFKKELFSIVKQAGLFASAIGGISSALQKRLPVVVRGLDPALRERIMLTVTGVNDCHYCEFMHSRIGQVVGVPRTESAAIICGDFTGVPDHDRPALVFAKHWAEKDGEPDPEEKTLLVEEFGRSKADQIEMTCRVIRLTNLFGNTFDSLLFKASGGTIGA